jgi:hypothetical protein
VEDDRIVNFSPIPINIETLTLTPTRIPFLGHVGVELMSCQGLTAKDDAPKEFIRVIANTAPRPIPKCQDGPGASCSIDSFSRLVREGMAEYGDFDGICKNKKT